MLENIDNIAYNGLDSYVGHTMQQSLCIIKPDGLERNVIGGIIGMIEQHGLKIIGSKMIQMTPHQARLFYEVHKARPFYQELVDFMISGPVLVLALSGNDAVASFRTLIGHTDPKQAERGTIRREHGLSIESNTIHGSDSDENAAREIAFFFDDSEILF